LGEIVLSELGKVNNLGYNPFISPIPVEYRCALDAAAAWLAGCAPLHLHCQAPELADELAQRFSPTPPKSPAAGALWLEPQATDWAASLSGFAASLAPGTRLAILSSLPPARWLPERRGWAPEALGLRPGGAAHLRRALPAHGVLLQARYGFHSLHSVTLNGLAWLATRLGRPELADRLGVRARLAYCRRDPAAWAATLELLLCSR
jgi:hypothetical protein